MTPERSQLLRTMTAEWEWLQEFWTEIDSLTKERDEQAREIERLKGELDAAEQHVKILREKQPTLGELIERARKHKPTPEEMEEHRRSFVHGSLAIDNEAVTRQMVDKGAESTKEPPCEEPGESQWDDEKEPQP